MTIYFCPGHASTRAPVWTSVKNPYPYLGVIFTQQSSSKDQARFHQGSSKDDFSRNHSFFLFATPRCGHLFSICSKQPLWQLLFIPPSLRPIDVRQGRVPWQY